ncbi:hypothetical protein [Mesorhizobium sp. B2-8-9]|uniref:hypothetical protein n=1 Tax=Mesorhizobium sp. B2-8-9 TaxID=2589899 RepID=UPI00112772E1|nr:hypothetical protein [Mesorhizobium sp. B2-8-9]TPI80422.1 hypothetical protein FJ423_12060 [Mesorhizobium sp. B2-8-9]
MIYSLHNRPMPHRLEEIRHWLADMLEEVDAALDDLAAGGAVDYSTLPTRDPEISGELWIAPDRTLRVSAG